MQEGEIMLGYTTVDEENAEIREHANAFAAEGINITAYAKEKLEHIISAFGNITQEAHLPSHEMAIYLLAEKDTVREGKPVINDAYIAHDQTVYPGYCTISGGGAITSERDIKHNLNKRIAGWAHSHGKFSNFFSGRDVRTFENFLTDYRMFKDIPVEQEDGEQYYLEYTYGLVMNQHNDTPYATMNIAYPQIQEGERIAIRNRYEHIPLNIIEEGHFTPDDEEKEDIVTQLKERVIIGRDGKRLGEYQVVGKNDDDSKKQVGDDLETKIKTKNVLKEKTFSEEQIPKRRYRSLITKYYQKLQQSENKGERVLGIVSKILAGEYRGNVGDIKKGDYVERGTRIWRWDKRIEAMKEIYKQHKEEFDEITKDTRNELKNILSKNRYAKKKHATKLKKIRRIMKKSGKISKKSGKGIKKTKSSESYG